MPSIDDARKIISESGNNLHCKVASAFRSEGWATLISPYYVDPATDRTREIDLIAEKTYQCHIQGHHQVTTIRIRLYVECKYIAQTVVFWFDSRDDARARAMIKRTTPFKTDTFIDEHHHIRGGRSVAKLFASENKKQEENNPIFKGLNQCLNGFIYSRGGAPLTPIKGETKVINFDYPVIICSSFDNLYGTNIDGKETPWSLRDNFLLEVNYAYMDERKSHLREYFLIDVVEYGQIVGLLKLLEHEVERAKTLAGIVQIQ